MASNQAQQLEAAAGFLKQFLAEQQQVQATPVQPPQAPSPSHPSTAQIQLLNQLLGRSNNNEAQAAPPSPKPPPSPPKPAPHQAQDSLTELAAGFLRASQRKGVSLALPAAKPPAAPAAPAPMPRPPSQDSLSQVAAEYLKALQGGPGPVAPPPAAPQQPANNILAALQQAAAAAAAPPQPKPSPPLALQGPSQLLTSLQLMSSINPGLAAAATEALTMANNTVSVQQSAQQAGVASLINQLLSVDQHHQHPQKATAAAQLAQHQHLPVPVQRHSSRGTPGAPSALSASAALTAAFAKQQKAHLSNALAEPTKPLAHQVSVVSSKNSSGNSKAKAKPSKASSGGNIKKKKPAQSRPKVEAAGSLNGSLQQPKPFEVNEVAAAIHHHHNRPRHRGASTAVTPAVTSGHASSIIKPLVQHIPLTTLQRWKLEQIEAHVKKLQDASQTVPRPVALLLADMRRKEERSHAKRLANRRSASTSRARKKALIEEMAKENALLRHQAMILSYLPDPIIAISPEGKITFCSTQVERVLKHEVSGLIGANIEDIIVPSSRESIRRLIRDVMIAEKRAFTSLPSTGEDADSSGGENHNQNQLKPDTGANPHRVSEKVSSSDQSLPPLLEVKYKADQAPKAGTGVDVPSDMSSDLHRKNDGQQSKSGSAWTTPTEMSSLTHKNSSSGPESSVDQAAQLEQPPAKKVKTCSAADRTDEKKTSAVESDESATSVKKARDHLNKNVEMCRLNKEGRINHKDDVMGASVTANNADAKLSSLMHHLSKKEEEAGNGSGVASAPSKKQPEEQVAPIRRKHVMGPKMANGKDQQSSSSESSELSKSKKRRSGNSSEDSGYNESGESPEESNEYPEDIWSSLGNSSDQSTGSDRSLSKKKPRRTRPLAPACKVSLIRNDLTTIWCELTASIRTKPDTDSESTVVPPTSQTIQGGKQEKEKESKSGSGSNNEESAASSSESEQQEGKEILLCLRLFREGEKVGEELRFCSRVSENTDGSNMTASSPGDSKVSSSNNPSNKDSAGKKSSKDTTKTSASAKKRPLKKRHYESEQETTPVKKRRTSSDGNETQVDDEKSTCIETMMELANHK